MPVLGSWRFADRVLDEIGQAQASYGNRSSTHDFF
jgi:hypothetical protein